MKSPAGGLARYPIKALILISFSLLFLQGISQSIKQIERIRTPAGGRGADPNAGVDRAHGEDQP